MLEAPTALSMLRTNRIILRRALDTGSADAGFAARGVLYVARLEREVRDGLRDGEAAVTVASRLARALTQTPPLDDDRAAPCDACPCGCAGGEP